MAPVAGSDRARNRFRAAAGSGRNEENGALLKRAAESGYDVLITIDGGIFHEQNIKSLPLAMIALRARTNRLADTRPLMPEVLRMLGSVQPGTLVFVG